MTKTNLPVLIVVLLVIIMFHPSVPLRVALAPQWFLTRLQMQGQDFIRYTDFIRFYKIHKFFFVSINFAQHILHTYYTPPLSPPSPRSFYFSSKQHQVQHDPIYFLETKSWQPPTWSWFQLDLELDRDQRVLDICLNWKGQALQNVEEFTQMSNIIELNSMTVYQESRLGNWTLDKIEILGAQQNE